MSRIPSLILTLVLLSACASHDPQPAPETVTVFAAASLTEAFSEITAAFEASHPGVDMSLSFAGSNTLRAQIEQGAGADVFASANTKEMDALVTSGLVAEGVPQTFLTNRLAVITPANNPAKLSNFNELARPGLKLVLATEEVPVGRYARQMLENAGADFKARVLANVVSNETDVKQVLAKVQLGEADAGIVYESDAVAAPELPVIDVPAEWNVLAKYPIAALKHAPHPDLANEFVAFVLSPDGQAILKKWGFSPR
jgi:molybdate transport system substrate-binding protein